ncbi:MAG: hypothetical protein IJ306_07410 [Oscillospiraceae bacterium]|nr:hypothetical protein [Oscillospiraceae bacterium]
MKRTVMTAVFMIILAVFFTSCGWEVYIRNPEDSLSTGDADLSTPEEDLSTEDESFGAENLAKSAEIAEKLASGMKNFTDGFYPLRDKNFELSAEEVGVTDGFWFYYDLHIKNEAGKEAVIPVKGAYQENGDTAKGGFSVIDTKTLAFYAFEYAAFIDRETLEVTELELDYSDLGSEVWVNGLMKYGDGFAILATPMGEIGYGPDEEYITYFVRFDESGKQVEKIALPNEIASLNRYYTMPDFTREMHIIETDEGRILFSFAMYNLDAGKSYASSEIADFGDEERKVVIYRYSDEETFEYIDDLAVLYENGAAVSVMNLGAGWFYYNEENMDNGTVSADGKAVIKDDSYGRTIELDFGKKTCEINYKIEEKHLYEIIEESADGKYSLWSANFSSGGDMAIYSVVLKNNKSGKITRLGDGGGMYGGDTDAGFLENGDVYLTDYTTLKIYNRETAEVVFTAAENFPLGKLDDGRYRYLFTFHRNPEDLSFIVVYFETGEGGIVWSHDKEILKPDGYFHHYEFPYNYKIGFLDAEGNLLESYDTGCALWYDHFGIQGVSMRYSEKELILEIHSTESNDGFIGTFDMETKTFSYNY